MAILAIDQGTTSTRAVKVELDGCLTVLHSISHKQHYPQPGWVEHDPKELLTNLTRCIELADETITAIGIDNQGESCLAWNRATGEPISPAIVWQDERTSDATSKLQSDGAEELTLTRAGLPLDAYFSASKLGWIMKHIPEAAELAASGQLCLGTTDAYFRHQLTGRFETDLATASRTSLMNLAQCEWDQDLCDLFGVPIECLPKITPASGELGQLAHGNLPLTASIVDQQAALRGHGCTKPGDGKITFGTGAFVLSLAGSICPQATGGPLPTVAWSDADGQPVFALDGGVHAASAAVNWARDLGLFQQFEDICKFDKPPAVSRGLVFVPALAGLACPYWDRRAKGSWMGLGLDTDPRDLMQALLEGVAYRAAEVVRAMDEIAPMSAPISIDGGMTANPYFCQFLADCLGREIVVSDEPELTALGTAMLAAEGAGLVIDKPPSGKRLQPNPQPQEWAELFAGARDLVQVFGKQAAKLP